MLGRPEVVWARGPHLVELVDARVGKHLSVDVVTSRGVGETGEENVTSRSIRVVGGVQTHADRRRDPEHARVVPHVRLVPRQVELLGPAYKKVPGRVAGDLRVVPVMPHAVAVCLGGELVVVKPRRRVAHVVVGAQLQGPVGQAVVPGARVHKGVDHHGEGREVAGVQRDSSFSVGDEASSGRPLRQPQKTGRHLESHDSSMRETNKIIRTSN